VDIEDMTAADHAALYIAAAVWALGTDVWSDTPATDSGQPEAFGYELLRLIFPSPARRQELAGQLAALARDPDERAVRSALEDLVCEALADDPAVAESVLRALTEFYQRQQGNPSTLTDLGYLLHREGDIEGAKSAYQQAIDAGGHRAFINMAHLLRFSDNDAAQACLDQAITIGDPDLTAQALVTLSTVRAGSGRARSDPAGAESALLQAIATGHREFAPQAMSELGDLRAQRGDIQGAREAYQQAIDTGHHEWADRSRHCLAGLLDEQSDLAGAREQYQRLVENGHENWAPIALEHLISRLQDDDDLEALRALHNTAVQTGNWSAPEVLVSIGFLLEERGDTEGARVAFQQAIDDGLRSADWLIEKLRPTADTKPE
jgi:tetratricopeptide (TPR) repeat protein